MAWTDWLPWSRRAQEPAPLTLSGGAPVGRVYGTPRTSRQVADPLEYEVNAGQQLVSALRSADVGTISPLQAIYEGALVRDSRLRGVSAARIHAITSRRWAVRPPVGYEQDRDALATAQSVSTILYETPGFARRRAELAQGILRGVGVLEHDWQLDSRGWVVSRPRPIDPTRLSVDEYGELCVYEPGAPCNGKPLSTWPFKFLVHSPTGGVHLRLQKRGALRPLLALALAKRFGLRWWLEMIERYGQPQVYGVVNEPSTSTTLLDETVEQLGQLSSTWRAAFRTGVELKEIPVTVYPELHKLFADYCNTEYAVSLLGGNLSIEVKDAQTYGSQAQAQVRGDILAADLTELDETICDQWLAPLVRFNRPGAVVPVIETAVQAQRPWTVAEYQAGLCTKNELRTSNGYDAIDGGDTFAAPSLPPAYSGTPLSLPASASAPGGAPTEVPFPRTVTTPSGATSQTSTHPLARLLRQSSDDQAR